LYATAIVTLLLEVELIRAKLQFLYYNPRIYIGCIY
jgi:hypothetical protein